MKFLRATNLSNKAVEQAFDLLEADCISKEFAAYYGKLYLVYDSDVTIVIAGTNLYDGCYAFRKIDQDLTIVEEYPRNDLFIKAKAIDADRSPTLINNYTNIAIVKVIHQVFLTIGHDDSESVVFSSGNTFDFVADGTDNLIIAVE